METTTDHSCHEPDRARRWGQSTGWENQGKREMKTALRGHPTLKLEDVKFKKLPYDLAIKAPTIPSNRKRVA
jgi:hypothetical protein